MFKQILILAFLAVASARPKADPYVSAVNHGYGTSLTYSSLDEPTAYGGHAGYGGYGGYSAYAGGYSPYAYGGYSGYGPGYVNPYYGNYGGYY